MSRVEVVAAAAVRVLAAAGARGLTHRAVDAEAGLPAGSTSNVVRSRRAPVHAVDGVLQAGALHGVQPDARVLAGMVDAALGTSSAATR